MTVTNITDKFVALQKYKIQFRKTTLGIETIHNRIKSKKLPRNKKSI